MNSPIKFSEFSKILVIALAITVATGLSVATAAGSQTNSFGFGNFVQSDTNSITHQNIINLTNQDRLVAGDSTLVENTQLDSAAMAKAKNMIANNYFDHYSPSGLSPWDFILGSGYDYGLAGENLAMDFSTAPGVNNAWLNSPEHRKNILKPEYTNIGVAVVKGQLEGHETTLIVQMFGRPQESIFDSFRFPLVNTVSNLLGIKL